MGHTETTADTTPQELSFSVMVDAPAAAVWDALTRPSQMQLWMGEPEMAVEVLTSWEVGSPITVRGFHHVAFENTGRVLRHEPHAALTYTQLSSISRLPDTDGNHTTFAFTLEPRDGGTRLTVTLTGFPTYTIFKHLEFYWRGTMTVIKTVVERTR